jgi:outer membrane murein-binding lipoprotein Lpp
VKQHKKIWIVASLVGSLVLAGCNNNQPRATSTASAPAVQETATTEAAPTAIVETTATTDAAAGSQATAQPTASTEATPVPTAAADAQTGMSTTVLSGSAIAFDGVTIAVDNAMIPSVSAYSGPVHQNMAGMDPSGMMSGAGNLTGTVLTLSGFKGDPMASTFFEPRIIVVPVSNYSSIANSMMMTATNAAGSSDAMTRTNTMTNTKAVATVEPSTSGMGAGVTSDGISFIQLLSTTVNGKGNMESSTMSGTMLLANSMTMIPKAGVLPVVQTNGKRIDFRNGKGVRFVTAFGQGQGAIANDGLYYVFNGLTNDGLYHVSAILPISSTLFADTRTGKIPNTELVYPDNADSSGFEKYLNQAVQSLDDSKSSGDAFVSSLENFDKLIGSLRIDDAMMQ